MTMVYSDRPTVGGQVPLLKHAIMQWLLSRHEGGQVRGDSYDIVKDTRASVPNVARALWDLQKQGLVTFSERKRAGTNGHSATTVLTHFNLTQTGLAWTAEKGYMDDLAKVGVMSHQDLNPVLVDDIDIDDITAAILAELPPVQALANLLKRATTRSLKIRRANLLLGYKQDSTALYSLAKSNPEAFTIAGGRIAFIGPDDWKAPTGPGYTRKNRAVVDVVSQRIVDMAMTKEAIASVALDHDPDEGTQSVEPIPERPRPIPERSSFPHIAGLVTREHKRMKAEEAARTLESIGMDEQALAVLGAFPTLSDLERDVLTLAYWLGWTDA